MLFNLSITVQLLVLLTILFFFILFCYRMFQWLTKDETMLNQLIANSLENIPLDEYESESENEKESKKYKNEYSYNYDYSNEIIDEIKDNIFLEPYKNYLISVIYRCDSEISVIREQIVCLSHILSKEPKMLKYRYEFICLVPPHMNQIYDKLVHLSHDFTAIRPFLISNLNDLGQFMFGGLNSRGKFVVDAGYLVDELDFILSFNYESGFVKCIKPEFQSNFKITRFLPIIATKDSISTVFRQMHTTGIGSFAEFEFLCFNYKVTFDFKVVNYTKIRHPMIELLYSSMIQKIIMFMYFSRYWSLPLLNYQTIDIS